MAMKADIKNLKQILEQAMWQHLENIKNSLPASSEAGAPDFDGYPAESGPIFQSKLL